MKYVWITQHRDSFPVAVMCDVLRVSTSGYYASLDREPSPRAQRHERIQQAVQHVHVESFGIYECQGCGEHKFPAKPLLRTIGEGGSRVLYGRHGIHSEEPVNPPFRQGKRGC